MESRSKDAKNSGLSRRRWLSRSLSLGVTGGLLSSSGAWARGFAQVCGLTPPQTEGPFYPVQDQPDKDNDLTSVTGHRGRAKGKYLYLEGTVTDETCLPVSGALVEIWQACASGRYNHPGDAESPLPLDADFQYWGRAVTDAKGLYRFKTVIPGHYQASPTWTRPPHIHFKVFRRGFHDLTTQMYFGGHPLNEADHILRAIPTPERARVVVGLETFPSGEPGAMHGIFPLTVRQVR